jgi:hypothetical protein
MASDDMLSWLRSTITADLAQAKAADEASPGPWVNTGQDGLGDAWQIHGAPTGDTTWVYDRVAEESREVPELLRVATLNYDDGGGVWEREAADHIVLQQPRDTIARCEAELALLDEMIPIIEELDDIAMSEGLGSVAYGEPTYLLVQKMVSGYRHRPGFDPAWLEEFVPPEQFIWERTDERIAEGLITDPAWMEVSRASQAVRASLGINGSMRDARSVKHPFIAAKGKPYDAVQDGYLAQYCAACGEIQPLLAHKNARARS